MAGRMPPWRVGEYLYMTITMIWLKFLVIWRIARAWALLEGIVPPENMTRCISNTYSLTVFWRGWHASFNQWLVRYLYVPLGGGQRRVLNGLLTFLFVAYWHDLEWKLLVWGLLNGGFLATEAAAAAFYRSERWQWFIKKPYFSHLAAFCIGVYLILVIIGNLVGYHVGVNGSVDIVKQLFFSVAGWAFLGVASAVVGAVVRLMFFLEDLKAAWGGGKTC
uniref:Uncharacterized protein n=1 Tax=Heterosigma akashiwo TaxID=2829 RepID=A0A7S3USN4_HETAK